MTFIYTQKIYTCIRKDKVGRKVDKKVFLLFDKKQNIVAQFHLLLK